MAKRDLKLISNACQIAAKRGGNKMNMAAIAPKPPIVQTTKAAIASAYSATRTTDSIGSTKDRMGII